MTKTNRTVEALRDRARYWHTLSNLTRLNGALNLLVENRQSWGLQLFFLAEAFSALAVVGACEHLKFLFSKRGGSILELVRNSIGVLE